MIASKSAFLDTAPIIYYLQRSEAFFDSTKATLEALVTSGSHLVTSDITTTEYCVWPYRHGRNDLIDAYDRFIETFGVRVVRTDERIAKRAALIRATYPAFKGMDALQLAVAVECGCGTFLTNDKQLRSYEGIDCIVISD